ncbi:hypothetical protein Pelo_17696 [Pelomyxa schiedti]|nr:hypothetical protein Pelo_17696 [Pelomyxa schiedti]
MRRSTGAVVLWVALALACVVTVAQCKTCGSTRLVGSLPMSIEVDGSLAYIIRSDTADHITVVGYPLAVMPVLEVMDAGCQNTLAKSTVHRSRMFTSVEFYALPDTNYVISVSDCVLTTLTIVSSLPSTHLV